jgi:hypothetical protein
VPKIVEADLRKCAIVDGPTELEQMFQLFVHKLDKKPEVVQSGSRILLYVIFGRHFLLRWRWR